MRRAVFDSEDASSRELRAAAAQGGEVPEPLGTYLATVRESSYRITDGDIAKLTEAGHSEEEIFELTVAAALGVALRRLEAGMRAVRGEV